jgi:hypothetical protein
MELRNPAEEHFMPANFFEPVNFVTVEEYFFVASLLTH